MKNYQIKGEDGQMYWVHRAVAVMALIFKVDNVEHTLSVLAAKRGTGSSDHQGLWNCPCGHLDFDETIAECCSRELMEETNFSILPEDLMRFEVNDSPENFRQNVTHRFLAVVDEQDVDSTSQIKPGTTGEPDEVAEVMWMSLQEIDSYEWAFHHDHVIKRIARMINL